MATSSITHNFVIKGDAVERFANALEKSFNMEVPDSLGYTKEFLSRCAN